MKIYGYIRRSSAEKDKTNYSIDSQREMIENMAKADQNHVQKWYIDEGHSGSTLKRPRMQEMLRDIASVGGKENIIIYVWMASRLTRSIKYSDSLRCVFKKYKVKIISYCHDWASLDEINTDPDLTIGPRMVNTLDETEVARDRKRTLVGLCTSARKGNYTKGGCAAPTGYRFVSNKNGLGRKVEIDENQVQIMLYMLKEIHDRKRTIDSLAMELNAKRTGDSKWSYSKVYRAVTDPIIYGRFKTSYIDIECHSPAYCSKKYYKEVQDIMNTRRKEFSHKYLFKNMIKCESCRKLCREVPTIHYPRNGDKRGKKIYKYYYCPKCGKRINEDIMLKKLSNILHSIQDKEYHIEIYEENIEKLKRIEYRLKCIDVDYDDGVLEKEAYRKERSAALKKKRILADEIKEADQVNIDYIHAYPYSEQKAIIKKVFKYIEIDFDKKKIIQIWQTNTKKY